MSLNPSVNIGSVKRTLARSGDELTNLFGEMAMTSDQRERLRKVISDVARVQSEVRTIGNALQIVSREH